MCTLCHGEQTVIEFEIIPTFPSRRYADDDYTIDPTYSGRHRSFRGTNVHVDYCVRPVACNRLRGIRRECLLETVAVASRTRFRKIKHGPVQFRGPEVDSRMAGTSGLPGPFVQCQISGAAVRPVFGPPSPVRAKFGKPRRYRTLGSTPSVVYQPFFDRTSPVRPLTIPLLAQSFSSTECLRFPGKTDSRL